MPRNKVESVRLTARISENTSSLEDVEFTKEKLKSMSQASLIREAISIYRKYSNGELAATASQKVKQEATKKPKKLDKLDKKLKTGNFLS